MKFSTGTPVEYVKSNHTSLVGTTCGPRWEALDRSLAIEPHNEEMVRVVEWETAQKSVKEAQ